MKGERYYLAVSSDLPFDARALLRELLGPTAKVWGRKELAEGFIP